MNESVHGPGDSRKRGMRNNCKVELVKDATMNAAFKRLPREAKSAASMSCATTDMTTEYRDSYRDPALLQAASSSHVRKREQKPRN